MQYVRWSLFLLINNVQHRVTIGVSGFSSSLKPFFLSLESRDIRLRYERSPQAAAAPPPDTLVSTYGKYSSTRYNHAAHPGLSANSSLPSFSISRSNRNGRLGFFVEVDEKVLNK